MEDQINPSWYNKGNIQPVDFFIDQDMPYLIATACKYLCRYRWKGKPVEDLQKAVWYIQKEIDKIEKEALENESS